MEQTSLRASVAGRVLCQRRGRCRYGANHGGKNGKELHGSDALVVVFKLISPNPGNEPDFIGKQWVPKTPKCIQHHTQHTQVEALWLKFGFMRTYSICTVQIRRASLHARYTTRTLDPQASSRPQVGSHSRHSKRKFNLTMLEWLNRTSFAIYMMHSVSESPRSSLSNIHDVKVFARAMVVEAAEGEV